MQIKKCPGLLLYAPTIRDSNACNYRELAALLIRSKSEAWSGDRGTYRRICEQGL